MRHPPGYAPRDAGTKVLRLRKMLYGLKQSGRRWYQKLTWIFVDELGLTRCDVDQAVFFRHDGCDVTIVVVHVDDCTIAATTASLVSALKSGLSRYVEVTDLGSLHWLLGIEVQRNCDAKTLSLSQTAYIDSILGRFNFEELKSVSSPMDPNLHLHSTQGPKTAQDHALMRGVPYREALGSLMYAAMATRPDIAFAVTLLSRFSNDPGPAHWEAVKRVFRYLKGSRKLRLTYGGIGDAGDGGMKGYADADGSMQEDRRAISGNAFLIDGGAVSWYSKRQEIVSLSTTESEYVAATHTAKEAIWLRQLIMQIFKPIDGPTILFSDNQSAIALTKDHQYHARTKHIDIRYHFLRWVCENGSIKLTYCPTADMVADALTKPLRSRSSTSRPRSDSSRLEGECWNPSRRSPVPSTHRLCARAIGHERSVSAQRARGSLLWDWLGRDLCSPAHHSRPPPDTPRFTLPSGIDSYSPFICLYLPLSFPPFSVV